MPPLQGRAGRRGGRGPRWAQVIDVEIIRTVTEWALPGLACPCCGTVTFADPPPGAHAGAVSYGPVLNAAAVLLTAYGNVPPERAAQRHGHAAGRAGLGGVGRQGRARLSAQLGQAGFDEAMLAALAAEKVLAADETPVNVLDKARRSPPAREAGGEGPGGDGEGGRRRRAARADRPDPGRAADLAAGHRLTAQGTTSPPGSRPLFTGSPDHRRLHRLPAPAVPARRHPAMLPARHPPMPRGHQTRPRRPAVLGRRHHRHPARGHQAVDRRPRPRQHRPGPADCWTSLRERYDDAAAFGITHNRLRDWHDGNHPGYALGCWLRDYKEQVFLFTRDFAVDWTNNVSERGAKAAKRHQAVSGYWHSLATLARWCRIRSYLDSAAAHGITALDAIRAALDRKALATATPRTGLTPVHAPREWTLNFSLDHPLRAPVAAERVAGVGVELDHAQVGEPGLL